MAPVFTLPFGKHKDKALSAIPADYLQWLTTIKLSSGLRLAVADELRGRGVTVAEATPPPPQCMRCKERTRISYSWHEDSLGRRRIKRTCGCGASLAFAPHTEPFLSLADAAESPTAVLDVLAEAEERGVELRSDGKAVRVVGGWDRLTVPLKQKLEQCRHQLAWLLGDQAEATR
jgi:hypothetical protein